MVFIESAVKKPRTNFGFFPNSTVELVKSKITMGITDLLDSALQLDDRYLKNEQKAEAKGVL